MALFALGAIVATPGALEALENAGDDPASFLARHVNGDWGELDAEDRESNDRAVLEGTRILSAYTTSLGERIWLITEASREVTTLLRPEDY